MNLLSLMQSIRSRKRSPAIFLPQPAYDRIYDGWLRYLQKKYHPWQIGSVPEVDIKIKDEHFLMFGVPVFLKSNL